MILGGRAARRDSALQPGGRGPRRRRLVVRDDDRARPRHVRRLGRLRGDGPLVLGARRGGLPAPRASGCAMASATWWLMVRRRRRRRRHDAADGLRRLVGLPLPAAVPRRRPVGRWTTPLLRGSVLLVGLSIVTWCVAILHTCSARALHAVEGGHLEPARALRSASATSAPTPLRDEPALRPVRGDPADGDRARHDHRHAAARGAARRDDRPVAHAERDGRPAAREERALVLRPPGRLPAALPGRRGLLPADPALRGARARRRQRHRRSAGRSR